MASQTQTQRIDKHLYYVELLSNQHIARKIGERTSINNVSKKVSLTLTSNL